MKKYTTLAIDTTQLASEVMTYLNDTTDVEDSEHQTQAFHVIPLVSLANTALNSTFNTLNLTVAMAAHVTVNASSMFNHVAQTNFILVPLADCSATTIKIFDVASDATLQTPDNHYLSKDCTVSATESLTSPILVGTGTTYTICSGDETKLSDILMIFVNEDPSSLLA